LPVFPDSVFVEDAAVALPGRVLLTRPGTPSREAEPRFLRETLAGRGLEIAQLEPPATLDGGDVLRIGRRLYVGASSRTNAAGIAGLDAWARRDGLEVVAVALGQSLHLKTAVTALDDDTIVANPAWVDPAAFAVARVVEVDPREPFGANVLRIGATLLANAAFPRTRERIEAHARAGGLRVAAVDISEFGKAEAGLTCLSLVLGGWFRPSRSIDGAGRARPAGVLHRSLRGNERARTVIGADHPGRNKGRNAMRALIVGLVLGLGLLVSTASVQAAVFRVVVVEVSDTAMYLKEIDNIRAAMKRLKVDGTLRVMRARFAGEQAGAIVVAVEYKDMAALAAADVALAADAENQAAMRRIEALRKIVSDSLYQEL
jgi:dimethylargininase